MIETLPTASSDIRLDYAFYSLRKKVQARVVNQKLECVNIRTLRDRESTEFSLKAQYLTFTWEMTLYSLKCHKREVQLATD